LPQRQDPLTAARDGREHASVALALAALAGSLSARALAAPTSCDDPDPGVSSPAWPAAPLSRRLSWAELLRRVYDIDVLACPRCAGQLRVLAAISDPPVVRQILAHLGLPTERPPVATARAPPQQCDLDDPPVAND
jgi:hypothetical protein